MTTATFIESYGTSLMPRTSLHQGVVSGLSLLGAYAAATVIILPEGVTRDDPSIASIKTGAARLALGARAHETAGIQITAVGIRYEDKAPRGAAARGQCAYP